MKKFFHKILELNREVWTIVLVFIAIFILTALIIVLSRDRNTNKNETNSPIDRSNEQYIEATTVKAEGVALHNTKSDCWIIYKDGVYDVSAIISKLGPVKTNDCGKEITNALDADTLKQIGPYLISYTFESQTNDK